MATPSPFATSFRQDLSPMQGNPQFMGGLGSMLQQYRAQLGGGQPQPQPAQSQPQPAMNQMGGANALREGFRARIPEQYQIPEMPSANISIAQQQPRSRPTTFGPESFGTFAQRLEPANPFANNEQYNAMMEYQKSMQPQQEQMDRMNELRTAFEGTGGYKDYRISQMEQQLQQRQQNPRMGMGLGGMRPTGMNMFGGMPRPQQNVYGGQRGFGGNPNNYGGGQQGGYGMPQMPQRNPTNRAVMAVMVSSKVVTGCRVVTVSRISTNSSNINSLSNSIKARTNRHVRNRNSLAATAWVNLHKVGMVVTAACRTLTRLNNTVNKWAVNPNNLVECIKAFRYKFGVGGFI